jgi:DNA-binding NarL/FixJ family response regulator
VLNGIEATRQIMQKSRQTKVLVLSTRVYEDYLSQILHAGACGYVLKDADTDELVRAIEEVQRGNSYLSPALSKTIVFDYVNGTRQKREIEESDGLTNREREILQLIAEGYSNQQIGELLCVSVKTVEAHKAHMVAKLNLKGSAALTRYAIHRELMQAEP